MNIFKRASQLKKQHPRKYSDYQDYVQWAKREQHSKGKKSAGKKAAPKKKRSHKGKRAVGTAQPKAVGGVHSIAQLRSMYKKQLEEKLAWGLLARDQAKNKTERKKKGKAVVETRRELNNLK